MAALSIWDRVGWRPDPRVRVIVNISRDEFRTSELIPEDTPGVIYCITPSSPTLPSNGRREMLHKF
jgi:hypothetical protein